MPAIRNDEGSLSTLWLTIFATVGASLILGAVYAAFSVWSDVQQIKAQNAFYHGPWPPTQITNRRDMP